jgi:protein CWC15
VAKRDLRAELLLAEHEARERKRKAEGRPSESLPAIANGAGDEEATKRRKILQEAIDLDKDDDDEEMEGVEKSGEKKDDDDERFVSCALFLCTQP